MVPEKYRSHYLYDTKLIIDGVRAEFIGGSPEVEDVEQSDAERGYYMKRVYVPTRSAFWYLFTGRFGDFSTSCHWWLVLVDRASQPQ